MKKPQLLLTALLGLSFGVFAQVPTNGLVAWYPFNGNANDSSGNGLHGTVENALLTADRFGNPNSAYAFDGITTSIRVEDDSLLDFSTSMSLCAWFQSNDSINGDQTILGKGRMTNGGLYDIVFNIPSTPTAIGFGFVTPPTVKVAFTDNSSYNTNWHFVVGTYDGQALKLYMDGILKDSVAAVVSLQNYDQPLFIGRELESNPQRFFNGLIDDVYLYDRALTRTEISQLFNFKITTGLAPTEKAENTIQVYPNPATDQLSVNFGDLNINSGFTVKLVNMLGQTVYSAPVHQQNQKIDLTKLSLTGIYFVQVSDKTNNIMVTKKVIVE